MILKCDKNSWFARLLLTHDSIAHVSKILLQGKLELMTHYHGKKCKNTHR